MRLKQPFLQLPVRFDADVLAKEVRALPASAWTLHPTGFVGNEAVRLVTPNGEETDGIEGPMSSTEWLQRSSYIRELMGHLGAVWGRSRLMGLAPGSEVPPHIDINYYWRTHLRIHIPVITNPGVLFTCGGETVHMEAGSCWIFDSFRPHDVQNSGPDQRIHLVLDTVGGGLLPDLIERAEADARQAPSKFPAQGKHQQLLYEKLNAPKVMSPWEIRCHVAFIREFIDPGPIMTKAMKVIDDFIDAWSAAWAQFGTDQNGRLVYAKLIHDVRSALAQVGSDKLRLTNGLPLFRVFDQLVLQVALAEGPSEEGPEAGHEDQRRSVPKRDYRDRIERPIFIVSTPRSGSTLLFETLEKAPDIHSTGQESHWLIEKVPGLSPADKGWQSNQLNGFDATPQRAEQLARAFYETLRDRHGRSADGRVRMLEKTPKNALRVPFFNAIWPDSHFVYLYRDVRQTIYSMMEAWQSGGFRTYPQLPGWQGPPWSLLLVPGWQDLRAFQLHEIVAHQWAIATEKLLTDLEQLPAERVFVLDYSELIEAPQASVERLAGLLGLDWDQQLPETLPLSRTTVSRPQPEKWRRIAPIIDAIWPIVENADARARSFLAKRSAGQGFMAGSPIGALGFERTAG